MCFRMVSRARPRSWTQFLSALCVAIVLAMGWWFEQSPSEQDQHPSPQGNRKPAVASAQGFQSGEYRVLRVVDGDTLLLKRDRMRARLQGIDTPETVKEGTPVEPWGPEATAYTKQFISRAGNKVRLEVDGESTDQYGRALVFVWHQGRLLNEELVREGLAKAKLGYDYSSKMKLRLRRAQDEAKNNRLGIWSN